MKKLSFILIIIICPMVFAQGWFTQPNGLSGINLRGICFPNDQTGYNAGTGGTIQKTTNAGTNWITLTSGTTDHFEGISFANTETGWVCSDNGTIFKTTNGGANWVQQVSGTANQLECIYFLNTQTGFSCGRFVTSRTTDGGTTWLPGSFPQDMTGISFINAQTGWGCCWGGFVYKTINGGVNWAQQNTGILVHIHGIYFTDSQNGWISVDDPGAGGILATTNGGTNWTTQIWNIPGQHSVYFINSQTGWTAGGDAYKTTNGGLNWTLQVLPSGVGECLSVYFVNALTGWGATAFGKVVATTTGGINGISQIGTNIPGKLELMQNYPNPFNPVTNIKFTVPKASNVQLVIYDLQGRIVETIINNVLGAGTYKADWNASKYSSGVYFYKLIADGFTETKRMVLVK